MNMLRSIREKKGMTVRDLAARASISAKLIADYEEGLQPLPLAHAKLIAKALWVRVEDLIPPAGSVPAIANTPSAPAQQAPAVRQEPAAAPPPRTYQPPAPQSQPAPAATGYAPVATAPAAIATQAPPLPPQPQAPAQGYPQPGRTEHRPGQRHESGQPTRRVESEGQRQRPARPQAGRGDQAGHGQKPTPPPPSPITEGQLQELLRLAARMDVTREQLEARLGKNLSELTRPEAKDWVKRVRAMADEIAPAHKVRYGQWPGGQEDREAAYLREQQTSGAHFNFKLFNGEQFDGVISEFTPYTITVQAPETGEEVVLRKLAIAYYRRSANGKSEPVAQASSVAEAEQQKPPESELESDRVDTPATPESDRMDEDRGV